MFPRLGEALTAYSALVLIVASQRPAAFEVSDIDGEYDRLLKRGVAFTREPHQSWSGHDRDHVGHVREPDSAVPASLTS
jgi:hypothetical protein